MKRKFPNLFSPLKVGNLTLKNRIISAPMTFPILTSDGCLTPEAIAFYELRAKGGAAVVTVSELIVHGATGKYYPVQVLMDASNAKDSLATAARAVKRHGAIPSMELSHGGKHSLTSSEYPICYGPSDEFVDGTQIAREMPKRMIDEILEAYGKAASLCKEAGFTHEYNECQNDIRSLLNKGPIDLHLVRPPQEVNELLPISLIA